MLALAAEFGEVDANNVDAVKRLLTVFITDSLELRRELVDKEVEGPHHLLW